MTWLTRSDLTGLPAASTKNQTVDEAIKDANRDVPEVTQVRTWVWVWVWVWVLLGMFDSGG
jgi:hypothetical protein